MASSERDLITLLDFSSDEIREMIKLAKELKDGRRKTEPKVLQGKTGILIFEKPSLRTRVTFETAIFELGGHPINLEAKSVGMGKRESIADVAHNLERWVDVIVARTFLHSTVTELAKFSSVPVINALSDTFHPCQSLAFGLTVSEKTNGSGKATIAFIGDGNNVCMSHMILAAKLGYSFRLACPADYGPLKEVMEQINTISKETGADIKIVRDPAEAVADADFVYTDVFTSMGQEEETLKREKAFQGYQVDSELISKAPSHALISHCLPAHRGEEITAEVIDSDRAIAFDEAENRLHAQKAAIVHLLS